MMRTLTALMAGVLLLAVPTFAHADNLPIYTSPIEVTGGYLSLTATAPDADTGQMVDRSLPAYLMPPALAGLMATPIETIFDNRWNGAAPNGMIPRQTACDGPQGVKVRVAAEVAKHGERAYDITCNFATNGEVFVRQSGNVLWLSYQLFNNTIAFKTTSSYTCKDSFGCPNDPAFRVRFAIEVLTVLRVPSLCAIGAEPPEIYLHAAQFESENAAAGAALFIDGDKFTAGELALQALETKAPISLEALFAGVRASSVCTGGAGSQLLAGYKELDIEVGPGIVLHATHPAITPPAFQNVYLPYGDDTCQNGFVWRDAYPGDHVCVIPQERTRAAADNAAADAHRQPGGGAYGPATCLPGFVWREARPGDLICVTPDQRTQTSRDNAAAATRRIMAPVTPSFLRPSIQAPPVAAPGQTIPVSGRFFPAGVDRSRITLNAERPTNAACAGGATELETTIGGGQPQRLTLPADGPFNACASHRDVTSLIPGTSYSFRLRDCDAVTCSLWSTPFAFVAAPSDPGAQAVEITLDGVSLGMANMDKGVFDTAVTIPVNTAPGSHTLRAVAGEAADQTSIDIQSATAAGTGQMTITASFYGDKGCPMRPDAPSIPVARSFSVYGTGFAGLTRLSLYLDSVSGPLLGYVDVNPDGTFCRDGLAGPSYAFRGDHTLIAVANGAVLASLPVKVVVIKDPA